MTKMTKTTTSKLLTCLVAFGCLLVVSGCNKGLKERATKAEKESAKATAELKSVQKDLKEEKIGSTKMVMDLEQAKTDLDNAVKAGKELETKFQTVATKISDLEGKVNLATAQAQKAEKYIATLTAARNTATAKAEAAIGQVEKLQSQIAQLKSAIRVPTTQPN